MYEGKIANGIIGDFSIIIRAFTVYGWDALKVLAGLAGEDDGLRSDRTHRRWVLSRAVTRALGSAPSGHGVGVLRAATIVAEFVLTGGADADGRARQGWAATRRASTPA